MSTSSSETLTMPTKPANGLMARIRMLEGSNLLFTKCQLLDFILSQRFTPPPEQSSNQALGMHLLKDT